MFGEPKPNKWSVDSNEIVAWGTGGVHALHDNLNAKRPSTEGRFALREEICIAQMAKPANA